MTENLTVLTSKYTATENGVLQGLLYVPDLAKDDPCVDYARQFVPDSAVHQSELPPTNYNLIAVAPWFNDSCTKAYLASARVDPLRAFLFYIPTDDPSKPPDADDDVWDLGDGGSWKAANHYPIFAVSGALGSEMMYQLSLYSGNVSEVPNGENITNLYSPASSDYIRIWTQLTVKTPTGLPDVWVFVLAIVGVVLAVILLTTLLMHAIWRRRRISLKRRVKAGEVNLEIMNIRRLTVPTCYVNKFPLFTYSYDPPQQSPPPPPTTVPSSPTAMTVGAASPTLAASHLQVATATAADDFTALSSTLFAQSPGEGGSETKSRNLAKASSMFPPSSRAAFSVVASVVGDLDYQPMCQICLEEFQDRVTIIRELPCGHIFHPDCIDEFLCQISSLCPLCKASMLPRGYCPPITNAMVRRERAVRRLRERVDVVVSDDESALGRIPGWGSLKRRFHHSTLRSLSAPGAANNAVTGPTTSVELQSRSKPTTRQQGQRAMGVSEATRRRMCELAQADADGEETDMPRCKFTRSERSVWIVQRG